MDLAFIRDRFVPVSILRHSLCEDPDVFLLNAVRFESTLCFHDISVEIDELEFLQSQREAFIIIISICTGSVISVYRPSSTTPCYVRVSSKWRIGTAQACHCILSLLYAFGHRDYPLKHPLNPPARVRFQVFLAFPFDEDPDEVFSPLRGYPYFPYSPYLNENTRRFQATTFLKEASIHDAVNLVEKLKTRIDYDDFYAFSSFASCYVDVPKPDIAKIVGKGGQKVTEIATQSLVYIKSPPKGSCVPFRIWSASLTGVGTALTSILRICPQATHATSISVQLFDFM